MNEQPTKDELSIIKDICGFIGNIVLQWSYVDRNLDLTLKIISDNYDTNNIIINNKNFSPFAGRKIRLLRICFEQLSSLIPFKIDGLSLMKMALDTSMERNDIIHSTFAGINSDRSINFQKLIITKKERKYSIRNFVHTIPTLLDLGKKIEVLARDIGLFGLRLRDKGGL